MNKIKKLVVAVFCTLFIGIGAITFVQGLGNTDQSATGDAVESDSPGDSGAPLDSSIGGGGVAPQQPVGSLASLTSLNLSFFRFYESANYVAAGTGVRNTGMGTISLRVPKGATLIDAWVYWDILNTTAGPKDKNITVNGVKLSGTLIGSGISPCWPAPTGFAYKANITLVPGLSSGKITIAGVSSKIKDGSSPWDTFMSPAADDVHAVLIFHDPKNLGSTVTIFDGYSEFSGGLATFAVPAGTTMFTSLIGDGQVVGVVPPFGPFAKSVSYTPIPGVTTTLQNVTLNGKDPSYTSRATYQGSLSDTDTFILAATAPAGASLGWNLANDCVVFKAMVFSSATSVP